MENNNKIANLTEYLQEMLEYEQLENLPNVYSNEKFDIVFQEESLSIENYDDGEQIAFLPIPDDLGDLLKVLTLLEIQL